MQDYRGHMKRFSVDDLINNPVASSNNNHIDRFMKHTHQMGVNNMIGDISELHSQSDYSHRSGMSSNFSTSPTKRYLNPNNFSQVSSQPGLLSFNNNLYPDSRRNSSEFNPNFLNAVRDLVGRSANQNSKSQRNSRDFTNIPCFNFQFNNILDDKYILDNLLILLKDQNGCRLIQKKIEEKPNEFILPLFEKMQYNFVELCTDQFGNYVVQKMVDHMYSDKPLVTRVFEVIKPSIYYLSVNQYGTRVLQRLLDYFCVNYSQVESQTSNLAMKELIVNHSYDLIMDTNGNHVFQKILAIYPKNENQFIYDELTEISIDIAKSKKGGCIFQRAFDYASPSQKVY
jgi:hypothetical protein